MTSRSRLSRESTTRSSMPPQYGHRMRRRHITIERAAGSGRRAGTTPARCPLLAARSSLGARLFLQLLPVQAFAEEEQEARHDDRHRAHEVQQNCYSDGAVDVEFVER